MSPTPEQKAREHIDALLEAAGWVIFDAKAANIHAGCGVAIREFPLKSGQGFADYLLYVDGKAVGVIEAKKVGSTLSGVEPQSRKYTEDLPGVLSGWHFPLAADPRAFVAGEVEHLHLPAGTAGYRLA